MEKGFRLVQCPSCPTKLRLTISEKQYGKTLKITCPKCSAKARVTIPHPVKPENAQGIGTTKEMQEILNMIDRFSGKSPK